MHQRVYLELKSTIFNEVFKINSRKNSRFAAINQIKISFSIKVESYF